MEKSNLGHFELKAKTGNNELLFLLDTGASKSVLHSETAKMLGLFTEGNSNCGGGLGTTQATVHTSVLEKLQLGSIEYNKFVIHIMDFSHPIKGIEARGGNKIDGVIGADILESGAAIIDYGNAKLYLRSKESSQ